MGGWCASSARRARGTPPRCPPARSAAEPTYETFSYSAHFVRLGVRPYWPKATKPFKIYDGPELLAGAWFVLAERVRAVWLSPRVSLPSFGVTSRDERLLQPG